MTRLGIEPKELEILLSSANVGKLLSDTNIQYVMSHFACADDSEHFLNKIQMAVFSDCVGQLKEHFPGVLVSMANSSGVFLSAEAHHDLVRPWYCPVWWKSNPE